ncbi:MAG: XamI family restriction endonuclease [Alphaproteobacteria bacterium]
MNSPPTWTAEELSAAARQAREDFRRERLNEPLGLYLKIFDSYEPVFRNVLELIETHGATTTSIDNIRAIVTDSQRLNAFRYLAAPPLSENDLQILAEVESLAKTRLRASPALAKRVFETVALALDPRRMPWLQDEREPSKGEIKRAAVASTALFAAQRVGTIRRGRAKQLEEAVKGALIDLGFCKAPRKTINSVADLPKPGTFYSETKMGIHKADIVIGLYDHRTMPIECKVSNSEVNSIKRVVKESSGKAVDWITDFGRKNVVPAAVIAGVFNVSTLLDAQEKGLAIFWGRDLPALTKWIRRTNI